MIARRRRPVVRLPGADLQRRRRATSCTSPTDWQDEISVFLHRRRDLLSSAAGAGAARPCRHRGAGGAAAAARRTACGCMLVDIAEPRCSAPSSPGRSWTLLHEAWVDGQTSPSAWGPPLWIPYSLMTRRHVAAGAAIAAAGRPAWPRRTRRARTAAA